MRPSGWASAVRSAWSSSPPNTWWRTFHSRRTAPARSGTANGSRRTSLRAAGAAWVAPGAGVSVPSSMRMSAPSPRPRRRSLDASSDSRPQPTTAAEYTGRRTSAAFAGARRGGPPSAAERATEPRGGRARRAVLGLLAAAILGACSPAPQRPNVLVVLVDTLRADHLSLYGYARKTSPNFDRFARRGFFFANAR